MDNSYIFKVGFICALIGFLLACLLKTCERPVEIRGSHTVETVIDTVYRDTGSIHILEVPFNEPVSVTPVIYFDSSACKFVRVYADSARDSSIVIYARDSVNGILLGRHFSYRLLGIESINSVTTITDTIPFKVETPQHHIYLSGEVGGNPGMFNASVGLDWLTKKKIGVGYRYGVMDRTHNVSLKLKVF